MDALKMGKLPQKITHLGEVQAFFLLQLCNVFNRIVNLKILLK